MGDWDGVGVVLLGIWFWVHFYFGCQLPRVSSLKISRSVNPPPPVKELTKRTGVRPLVKPFTSPLSPSRAR